MTNTITKHWRLALLVLGIILFIWILYLLKTVILPFAVGLVLGYLAMPLVLWLESKLPPRRKWPDFRRVISVLIVMLVIVCVIGAFGYFVVSAVVEASKDLLDNAPYYVQETLEQIQVWLDDIIATLPVDIQEEVNDAFEETSGAIGNSISSLFLEALKSIPTSFGMMLGFAVLPFFLFYLLKDSEKLKTGFISVFSEGAAEHARQVSIIIERVLGRYIRAQIMLGLIVGYFTFIGLYILGFEYKYLVPLAMLAGVLELVPIVGPWIAGAVAVVVTLAIIPDRAVWVAVLFVCVQLLENNLLVPKIQSAYLRIHPAVMIFLLVLGAYIAGFWGLLIIGPLTATLVAVFKYIRDLNRQPKLVEAGESA